MSIYVGEMFKYTAHMDGYLKLKEIDAMIDGLLGVVSIVCGVAAVVQFVRGFFDHAQWLYMVGFIVLGSICKSVAFGYRETSRQYMREGVVEDDSSDRIVDQVEEANPRQPGESIEDYHQRITPLIHRATFKGSREMKWRL